MRPLRFKKLSVEAEIHVPYLPRREHSMLHYIDKPFTGVWETYHCLACRSYETFKCSLLQQVEFPTVIPRGRHNYHYAINQKESPAP